MQLLSQGGTGIIFLHFLHCTIQNKIFRHFWIKTYIFLGQNHFVMASHTTHVPGRFFFCLTSFDFMRTKKYHDCHHHQNECKVLEQDGWIELSGIFVCGRNWPPFHMWTTNGMTKMRMMMWLLTPSSHAR